MPTKTPYPFIGYLSLRCLLLLMPSSAQKRASFSYQSTISQNYPMKGQEFHFIHNNIPAGFGRNNNATFSSLLHTNAMPSSCSQRVILTSRDFEEVEVLSCVFLIGMSTFTVFQPEAVQKVS